MEHTCLDDPDFELKEDFQKLICELAAVEYICSFHKNNPGCIHGCPNEDVYPNCYRKITLEILVKAKCKLDGIDFVEYKNDLELELFEKIKDK